MMNQEETMYSPTPIHSHTAETILLVDDYDAIRLLMKSYLERKGYRVVEASDGDEAVRIANEECNSLRLIVMDVSMPTTDGLTATRLIREIKPLCEVPIVACTARASQTEREAAANAGCSDLVAKPIGKDTMEDMISRFLSEVRH
jgi:CheY-like chemotaxis protein